MSAALPSLDRAIDRSASTDPHPEPTPASAYWESRARRFAGSGAGLGAVCSYGMPGFYNRYIHLVQWLALRSWLRVPAGTTVLDVGCGVGRWSRRLARTTATFVTGVDLAPTMVAEARRRAAREGVGDRCHFLVADLPELRLRARFDRVLGITVLQHVVDTARFERAVERLAEHLAPGGRALVLEAAPSIPRTDCDSATFRARPESVYRAAFARAGLQCVAVLGVDPMPLKLWLLPRYARLPRAVALAGLAGVTALSLPLDALIGRGLPGRSWHKLFVLRGS